jgi:hypothetical protein
MNEKILPFSTDTLRVVKIIVINLGKELIQVPKHRNYHDIRD